MTDILVAAGACSSKSEARRLIEGGGVKIGESKVEGVTDIVSAYSDADEFVLHKGKKFHVRVVLG